MRIDGLSEGFAQAGWPGRNQSTDSVSRNLEQQITAAQKKLQDLSSNQELSMEEKMKKRQEIQQEISDLNNQLRQHQMELKRDAQREKDASTNNTDKQQTDSRASMHNNQTGLSQASMKSIISADNAINQASVQGSVANKMEGKAGVLKAEIAQDAARGGNTQMKKEELAKTEQTSINATASQMNTLNNANKELHEAATADADSKKAEQNNKTNTSANTDQRSEIEKISQENKSVSSDSNEESSVLSPANGNEATGKESNMYYRPIDIRL